MDYHKSTIDFVNLNLELPLESIKIILIDTAESRGKTIRLLVYEFVSREKIKEINTRFLRHNYETDIITFDYSKGSMLSGEVYICQDVVLNNALHYGVEDIEEIERVIFHGLLHLVGYKDGTIKEKDIMRKMENHCLTELSIDEKRV